MHGDMRLLLPLFYIALTVYALADIVQQPSENPHHLPKVGWILLVVFMPYIGAGAWLLVKYLDGPQRRPLPPTPLAPDDDPAYRVWLNEQERRRKLEGQ